jgi:hypothetical protein
VGHVHTLYGLVSAEDFPSIVDSAYDMPAIYESGYLPLGYDDLDGQICLNRSDNSVVLVEYSVGPMPVGLENPWFVAETFGEFLASLHASDIVELDPYTFSRYGMSHTSNKKSGLDMTPDGYCWHTDPREPGRMQLVPARIHQSTGHWNKSVANL